MDSERKAGRALGWGLAAVVVGALFVVFALGYCLALAIRFLTGD